MSDFLISNKAFIDVKGDFNSANNGNVSVDGSGTGGFFLVRGCYRVGGGQPDPNIFGGSNLIWCTNGGCVGGNNSGSATGSCNLLLLPITLIKFEARSVNLPASRENTKVTELTWTTANEINNEFFTVERSANGIDFQEVEQVKGAGTSSVSRGYKIYDHTPFEGITYYRLKQTDYDHRFSYSKIIQVATTTNLTIFPNPVEGENKKITIYVKSSSYANLAIDIVDIIW